MIARPLYAERLETPLRRSRVVALLGAREVGKTTLACAIANSREATSFDLEDPRDLGRLQEPMLALAHLSGLVVLDEIQRLPGLYPVLRVLADRPERPATFLVLGSSSPELVRQTSESLAGRVEFVELAPFDLTEVGAGEWQRAWLRGGFPRAFLAASEDDSAAWWRSFIQTFLERDIPQLGLALPAAVMHRFWTMLAHRHGAVWNASALARSLGLSDKTVRRYLDVLTGTSMVCQLQPWYANTEKRQVKAPKAYLRDTGLLHALLDIETAEELDRHPVRGLSWEGFVIEQLLRVQPRLEPSFWGAHTGAELDLLLRRGTRFWGFEARLADAPRLDRSLRGVLETLEVEHLWVVGPHDVHYDLAERISVVGLAEAVEICKNLA